MTAKQMTGPEALKAVFADSAKPLALTELKALTPEERTELYALAAQSLGVELKAAATK